MTTVTRPAYAHLLPAETFRAWRVLDNGCSQPIETSATTLADAAQQAAQACRHKDYFTVLQTVVSGARIEHVYYVKQQAARWIADPDNFGAPKRVQPLKAERLFCRELREIEPVEPWRWTPGADVVGVDRREIGGLA